MDNPILNKVDGKTYDISKADLHMFFAVIDLLLPTVVPTTNFYVLDENGHYLPNTNPDGDIARGVLLKKDGGQLYWKRGFVITKKGLYMLSFTDFITKSNQPHITECPSEEVKFNYNFNNLQSNFYFLQYAHDENVRSWAENGFNKSGNYAICVD